MKKLFLLSIALLVCMTTLSAQISQKQADGIVIERLSNETKLYCVYAKEDVQTSFEVITATGETLELSYLAWVYYVSYTGETNGKYLIVKENNGNLLEVNTKNDSGPDDLEGWKFVPIEIPFTEYSLVGTSCQWTNLNYDETVIVINTSEELGNHISCTEGSYPEINFSQYMLLLASGKAEHDIFKIIVKDLLQFSCGEEYELNIEIFLNDETVIQEWAIALMVKKVNEGSHVNLNVIYENLNYYPTITPDKTWYIEYGMPCPEGDTIGCWCYLGITTIKTGDIKTFNGKEYFELITDYPVTNVITYAREEEGKVFFYVEDCDKEYLMYDYNLNIGDEVYLVDPLYPYSIFNQDDPCELTEEDMNYFYRCKITDIDVIVYDGVPRKRLKVEHFYPDISDYWVEGIGAMRGITYQISSQMSGAVHQLKDCYESDELIFENENPEYEWCP